MKKLLAITALATIVISGCGGGNKEYEEYKNDNWQYLYRTKEPGSFWDKGIQYFCEVETYYAHEYGIDVLCKDDGVTYTINLESGIWLFLKRKE